jgi:hypothetical protein
MGLIGWIVVFGLIYFLKDVLFKKDKNNDNDTKSEK